ncbi:MAG TPA: gluconeogenesis factor YvcK family protein [Myxococcota bacterium]|nr:gluconeogenesis factor YvcK family protein [Myxococcota bacterium]
MNRAAPILAEAPQPVTRTVTVVGGGTGSFHVLTGLRELAGLEVRSIVTMMDSGGDSGRLRDEFGVLPPGDLRRCLVALSDESALLRDLFSFRFSEAPLAGRSFGNLFLLALTRMLGSEREATQAAVRLLRIRGRVIPVTWDHAHLRAELEDGTRLEHEAALAAPARDPKVSIRRVFLAPRARANPDALEAIRESDFVVLAPGDLYSSTIPNLLVEGIPEALQSCTGRLIYVQNLMTRRGETHGYSASRHVAEIARYAGRVPDAMLVHRGAIRADLVERYAAEEAHPIELDLPAVRALGVRVVQEADLLSDSSLVRHDPARTAEALERVFARLAAPAPGFVRSR